MQIRAVSGAECECLFNSLWQVCQEVDSLIKAVTCERSDVAVRLWARISLWPWATYHSSRLSDSVTSRLSTASGLCFLCAHWFRCHLLCMQLCSHTRLLPCSESKVFPLIKPPNYNLKHSDTKENPQTENKKKLLCHTILRIHLGIKSKAEKYLLNLRSNCRPRGWFY